MSPGKSWVPTRKLVPNLLDKQKYVVHYRNLQLYKKHESTQDNLFHAERMVKAMNRAV